MKNLIKISMMLFVSQMIICMESSELQMFREEQVDKVKVTMRYISEKNARRHATIQEFILGGMTQNNLLYKNEPGLLSINELKTPDAIQPMIVPAYHGLMDPVMIFIHDDDRKESAKSYFHCSLAIPLYKNQNDEALESQDSQKNS